MDIKHRVDMKIKSWTVLISMQLFTSVWSAAVPLSTGPMSTNTKLLMDVMSLLSSPAATEAVAQNDTDTTARRCQLTEVSTCFNDALGTFYKSFLNDDRIDMKLSICSLADHLETCSALYQPECRLNETLTFSAITKGARYFCTVQGYKNYLGLMPCLSQIHVVKELKECKQKLTLSARDLDRCKLFDSYVTCAVDSTKLSCPADIEDTLKESLTVLLLPYREAICPASQSETGSVTGNPSILRRGKLPRSRREAEDFGSFFSGGSFDGLAGAFSPANFFGGEMPALTDYTMSGLSSSETASTPELAAPGYSWEQIATEPSAFSNQDFPWDLLQRLSHLTGHGAGSSEEVSTMPTDVVTQEANSEEVPLVPLENTTPEISSEEVNTAAPGVTTQADSSEEVSTTAPDGTTQADSSEEVSTTAPDGTTQADSSEEVSTTAPDGTTQADSSEEVSTPAPGATTQADSSEEVTTTAPDGTTQADSSEEVSTTAPGGTTQADSSEEISTAAPDATTQADSSEEVSTPAPDATTQADSSEDAPATSPDVTTQEPNPEEVSTINPETTTSGANSEEVASSLPETTTSATIPTTPQEILPSEPAFVATTTPETPPTTTTTTTTSHQVAPFHCYECHSGTVGYWLNPMCPSSGKIHGWAALPVDCQGPCVSVLSKYPKGEVYRACSTNYYFPFRVPYDGCIRHNQELYCFCSGDLCNNKDMVADQQAFILKGLITNF